jgi:hypothetical protein
MHGRAGQQRRDRRALAEAARSDRMRRCSPPPPPFGARRPGKASAPNPAAPSAAGVGDVEHDGTERAAGQVSMFFAWPCRPAGQHRLVHFQAQRRVGLVDAEQVGIRADEGHQRHDDLFADRIDRRVRHLGEQLLEIAVERLVLVGQHRQRESLPIEPVASSPLTAIGEDELDVLLRVAERPAGSSSSDACGLGSGRLAAGRSSGSSASSRSTCGRAWRADASAA